MIIQDADIYIVGAGFFGLTIAECAARELGLKSQIFERRPHIGGNAYSSINPETGIEIHNYGAHLFHCQSEEIWNYVNRFSSFTPYRHYVHTISKGKQYPMPINLATICAFLNRYVSPDEARAWVQEQAAELGNKSPQNLEEKAISLIGRPLYEAFIKGYTAKQWQTDPRDLPANIITRLPVRFNFDARYFSDRFEGLPLNGYTSIFNEMTKSQNIHISYDTDYFTIKNQIPAHKPVIYTGAIDRFFDYQLGTLQWRTLDFEQEILKIPDFQGTPVMNYADEDIPFTRIHEFKHFHPERDYIKDKTIIFREYSRFATQKDEPYYPVNTTQDEKLYDQYKSLASQEHNVIFGGRLGTYRYLDMHQAIGAALKLYENQLKPYFSKQAPLKNEVTNL